MSHLSDVRIKIRDLDELRTVADQLGFSFMENQKRYAWYGRIVGDSAEGVNVARERGVENLGRCTHALRLKDHGAGDYEIGIAPAVDGDGWTLLYDSWGPGQRLEKAGGKGLATLKREYAVAVATRKAQALTRSGFSLQRQDLPSGRVRLRLIRR